MTTRWKPWAGLICLTVLFAAVGPALGGERKPSEEQCRGLGIDVNSHVNPATGIQNPTPTAPAQPCHAILKDGFPVPDPTCTPGAANATITADVLRNPLFKTGCIRNMATIEDQKKATYRWYDSQEPSNNIHAYQTCELDHFIPLELGGADTLDNIWPQCGPDGVSLANRYFKQKDLVENYLAMRVKSCNMDLNTARVEIVSNWMQYLSAAQAACHGDRCAPDCAN